MYILQYKISDLYFRLRSDFAISDDDSWAKFSCSSDKCDYLYECRMHETLPPDRKLRRYYDPIREREYAATEELDKRMYVHLSTENLPWGSNISQLYPQLALPHILLLRQRLLLHASYIFTRHGGIVFTAPSGTGKSTQAELWRTYRDATVVNGDRAVIGVHKGEPMAHGFPLSGSSGDCLNRSSKLLAVVSLKQAPENTVRRLMPGEAVGALVNGSYLPEEYRADLPKLVDVSLAVAQAVPILELRCRPDREAVEILEKAILSLF